MCFSATGSFAIAGVLTGLGVGALSRNRSRAHRMFAAVPLIFAVQQAAEGVVWLTVADPVHGTLHRAAVNLFLACAVVVWPSWLPFSLRSMEQDDARRRALGWLAGCGVAVSLSAAAILARWHPTARVVGHSIGYDYHASATNGLYFVAYVIPTIVPFFVSTAGLTRTIGVTLIASLAVAAIVQRDALTSVWCFFAAILSGMIVVAASRARRFVPAMPVA